MPRKEIEIIKYGNPSKGFDLGIEKGNLALAVNVTAQAKLLCPVAEKFGGTLRNSIMWKAGSSEGGFNDQGGKLSGFSLEVKPSWNEGYVGTAEGYGVYVEFGTRKMKAQPYLRPAIAIVVKGQSAQVVLAKIQQEEMLGALKEGQSRVQF